MSLAVLDIECIENHIVKVLEVYKDGQTVGYSFLPLKFSNQHPNFLDVQSIFMESIGAVVRKNILNLKNLEATERNFLQKVVKNVRFFHSFWKQRLLVWMTTLALKFSF